MSNTKVLNNLNIKQDVYISGSQKIKSTQAFNNNITTSSAGMYDINSAFQVLDTKIVDNKQVIKNAYEAGRYKYTGSFDANGDATINLTSLATSGSAYFSISKIDNIDVQVLVDSNGDLHYKNDLVSVQLYSSGQNLLLELSAPAAASKPFRILAINQVDLFATGQVVVVVSDWYQEAVLSGSYATNSSDNFGNSVAMNSVGNRVAVTAYNDELPGGSSNGLVYIYDSSSNGWSQTAIISGSSDEVFLGIDANYGDPIDITHDGSKLAVSNYYESNVRIFNSASNGWKLESKITEINGLGPPIKFNNNKNKIFVGTPDSGKIYVFSSASNGWSREATITGSISSSVWAGNSISINSASNMLAAGAYRVRVNSVNDVGIVYIFTSSSNGWKQQTYLTGTYAIDSDDYFGYAVDLNQTGNILAVGAPMDEYNNSSASGSDKDSGLIYIFNSSSNGWSQTAILTGSEGRIRDPANYYYPSYGPTKVKLNSSGNSLLASALTHGKNGPYPNSIRYGQAYIFQSASAGWNEIKKLTGSYAVNDLDEFGYSIAWNTNNDVIIVGAKSDESGSTQGVGLAYIFRGI